MVCRGLCVVGDGGAAEAGFDRRRPPGKELLAYFDGLFSRAGL
ncbi:hypothetical protein [Desulfofundulus luciae]|nr:hypothetical protein [Desulfofundulus luciae]